MTAPPLGSAWLQDLLLDDIDALASARPFRSSSAEAYRAAAASICDARDYASLEDRRALGRHPPWYPTVAVSERHRQARIQALREVMAREATELAELAGPREAASVTFAIADALAVMRA